MILVGTGRPRQRSRLAWQLPAALALGALAVPAVGIRPALIVPLYLAAVTAELCRTDAAVHRLPNALVLPGYGFSAVGLAWEWAFSGTAPWPALGLGAAGFALLLLMHLAGGMGMGDVKLAGVLGLGLGMLGADAVVTGFGIGFVAGGAGGVAALLVPGGGPLRRIPFGPFLLAGFWAAIAVAPVLGT